MATLDDEELPFEIYWDQGINERTVFLMDNPELWKALNKCDDRLTHRIAQLERAVKGHQYQNEMAIGEKEEKLERIHQEIKDTNTRLAKLTDRYEKCTDPFMMTKLMQCEKRMGESFECVGRQFDRVEKEIKSIKETVVGLIDKKIWQTPVTINSLNEYRGDFIQLEETLVNALNNLHWIMNDAGMIPKQTEDDDNE
jgi:hypothetical protein